MRRSLAHRAGMLAALLALVYLGSPSGPAAAQDAASPPGPAAPAPPAMTIRVDRRVELLCVVFRLAGHPEYNRGRTKPYVDAVEERFGRFRDHPAVRRARDLRASHGVSYDAVMSLAIHLSDDGRLEERIPFDPRPDSLDRRWTLADARAFLSDLRSFQAETRFDDFFDSQRPLYSLTESRLRDRLDREAHLDWFPRFFGERPGSRFTVIPALLNGPNNYGPHCPLPDGTDELYAILGAWFVDQNGQPTYGSDVVETLVHEFAHSYVNPLVDRHQASLQTVGETLYDRVAAAMERMAYGHWTTMMRETLVRACTLRYIRQHQGPLAALGKSLEERSRQFIWVTPLADLLGEYEGARDKYPTLDDFFPRIVLFFEEQVAK